MVCLYKWCRTSYQFKFPEHSDTTARDHSVLSEVQKIPKENIYSSQRELVALAHTCSRVPKHSNKQTKHLPCILRDV